MNRKRKQKKVLSSRSIIYIATIVTLSFMGVGYGMWTDQLSLGMSVRTGNIDPAFLEEYSSEKISLQLSEDDKTLHVSGDIYPSFSDNIPLNIIDRGSVPVVLYNVSSINHDTIIDLEETGTTNRLQRYSGEESSIVNSFLLNIAPNNDYNGIPMNSSTMSIDITYDIEDGLSDMQMKIDSLQEEVNRVEDEINRLQEELDRINRIKRHEFNYKLQFEQGI